MWIFLISFFVAIVLIFTLIARAAKKRKEYTTPGTKNDEAGPEKAAPKKTRSLGWLGKVVWTILVLALLGFVGWKFLLPKIAEGGKPDYTLSRGTDSYIKLPMKREITVVVMPSVDTTAADTTALDDTAFYNQPALEPGEEGYYDEEGSWTAKLIRPYRAPAFWIEPEGMLDLEKFYAEGEPSFLSDFDPTREVVDTKKVTGVRFRNNGSEPVRVRIRLY